MSFGYSVTTSIGRVQAGEMDEIWAPRCPRQGTVGVVMCHGSGNPHNFIDPTLQPSSVKLAAALATAGIPLIAGDFGGQAWGGDTIMSRIDAAWAVLQAQYPTMRTDKVALLGGSMGGAAVARYSQLHPTKTACVVGLIPLWDLVAYYNGRAAPDGNQASIAAAYGVATGAALPSTADIATGAHLAASVPLLAGYSTADATVLPAWVLNYVAAINTAGGSAEAVITDSTFGHSDAAIGGMPIPTVGAFLAAHGA